MKILQMFIKLCGHKVSALTLENVAFFCEEPVKLDATYGPQVWPVRTYDFKDSILKCCKERADEWSEK